jgi:hypothetical protein
MKVGGVSGIGSNDGEQNLGILQPVFEWICQRIERLRLERGPATVPELRGIKRDFSSVQGLFRLLKQSYWESYCLFL